MAPSAETRVPKVYFYNSAKILPERLKPERRNDDSAKKMNGLALFSGFYYAKREYFGTFVSTFLALSFQRSDPDSKAPLMN